MAPGILETMVTLLWQYLIYWWNEVDISSTRITFDRLHTRAHAPAQLPPVICIHAYMYINHNVSLLYPSVITSLNIIIPPPLSLWRQCSLIQYIQLISLQRQLSTVSQHDTDLYMSLEYHLINMSHLHHIRLQTFCVKPRILLSNDEIQPSTQKVTGMWNVTSGVPYIECIKFISV